MIQPNMATMLGFIATDAALSPALLDRALRSMVHSTFNSITVDGDTSTNDTVAVLANGQSGARRIASAASADYKTFCAALERICMSLALAIVEDGEGAQRVIEIEVRGAPSDRAAGQIARTVANSPLVKTAFAGADPNWGRIPGRSRTRRREIRLGSAPTSGSRESPFVAVGANTHSTSAPFTRRCSRATFPCELICIPARVLRASGPATSRRNTSTSTQVTVLNNTRHPASFSANATRFSFRVHPQLVLAFLHRLPPEPTLLTSKTRVPYRRG